MKASAEALWYPSPLVCWTLPLFWGLVLETVPFHKYKPIVADMWLDRAFAGTLGLSISCKPPGLKHPWRLCVLTSSLTDGSNAGLLIPSVSHGAYASGHLAYGSSRLK